MEKDMNLFEHDYIVEALGHFAADIRRGHADVDKHACILTAFMQGQLRDTKNRMREIINECEAKTAKTKFHGALERIIEDPVFKKSHHSFLIQLADCVAFALLKREIPPTPNIQKYRINEAFSEQLASVCFKAASAKDPLGIVRR